ncbi:pol poly [Paramuricea clavata]|uniref:Pol poly n=1 Tax=Paramuricea clavata TaxID=317549 RepID=A0A7D9LSR6_PARCT|nr:pol poly [Paramuricea clavata]
MLVVPQLSWPILFGENHLHSTQALVNHAVPSIEFRHPNMQFMIKCSLENPQQAFQNSTPRPHARVTCLLTGGPSVSTHKSKPTMLHRGMNSVPVYFTLFTALSVLSPDLWLEGKTVQPGLTVLGGTFNCQKQMQQPSTSSQTTCYASMTDIDMPNPNQLRYMVPSDITLRRHLIRAFHDSLYAMHWGREATFEALSAHFYWKNMSKHVRNWIRRCPQCIRFKSKTPNHGPMQVRIYQRPFHTLGVDYVGELPVSVNGNKWIITAVCPYSNFLRAILVADKHASTATRALLDDVFLQYGFPTVLQSDQGGEWTNALLHHLTKILSIAHVFTTSYAVVI